MSGIVGLYYLDNSPVDPDQLQRMTDSLAHRGPDGGDRWLHGSIGLGHRMLWTTPESLGEQLPLSSGQYAITADARIDNRSEIKAKLGIASQEIYTDSALILAAYRKWGEACSAELIGDFAFAIWDGVAQKLVCGRDPMGVKPFYYYLGDRLFAFASELKALLCHPRIPQVLNELKLGYYLEHLFEDQEITFYQDLRRLPAAHTLSLTAAGRVAKTRYWALDPQQELHLKRDEDYVEAFREVFDEAVRCRLRSAYPVGSALSGGLDSSSIACTARQMLQTSGREALHTFSAIFPDLPAQDLPLIDERRYMDSVKQLEHLVPHDVRADQLSPLTDLLWQDDEPLLAPNLYIHQGMYRTAQQQGVRVFLDGIDGDSAISHGWRYLTELTWRGQWLKLWGEVNATSKRLGFSRPVVFNHYCLKPIVEELWDYGQSQWSRWSGRFPLDNPLIQPGLVQRLDLGRQVQQLLSQGPALTLSSRQHHFASLATGLYPHTLELNDKAAAQVGVEGRYPFFDRRLLEFCLSLPADQKCRQGWSRSILRRGMEGVLPPQVQWRTSKGKLGANFERRLLAVEREKLDQVVTSKTLLKPYVNLPALQQAYQRYQAATTTGGTDDLQVFTGVTLGLWLKARGFAS